MQKLNHIVLLLYSILGFIGCSFINICTYYRVQSPDGELVYFLGILIAVFSYLIVYIVYQYYFKDYPLTPTKTISVIIIKSIEISFLFTFSAFTLSPYFLLITILILHILGILYFLYLYQKQHIYLTLMQPNYDLIIICLLALFLAYLPDLQSHYPKLSIQNIKLILDSLFILMIVILSLTYVNRYRTITCKNA